MYKLEFGEELLLLLFTKNIIQRPGSHLYKSSVIPPWSLRKKNHELSPHTYTIKMREKLDFSLFSYPIYGGKCFLKEAQIFAFSSKYISSEHCLCPHVWLGSLVSK